MKMQIWTNQRLTLPVRSFVHHRNVCIMQIKISFVCTRQYLQTFQNIQKCISTFKLHSLIYMHASPNDFQCATTQHIVKFPWTKMYFLSNKTTAILLAALVYKSRYNVYHIRHLSLASACLKSSHFIHKVMLLVALKGKIMDHQTQ